MSRLLSELRAMKAEQDKVVDSAIVAREEACRFSIELVAFRSEVEALHARGANPDVVRGEVFVLQERVALLGSREAELLVESKVAWAEFETS
ncbi:hypothetical protein ACLOJK_007220 [Asimina triloba]